MSLWAFTNFRLIKGGKRTITRIIKRVKEIFDAHSHLRLDSNGKFFGEIYADYRDEFEERTIVDMFKVKNPREKFYESLDFFDFFQLT